MAKSQELFEQIKELFTEFESEHNGTSKVKKSNQERYWRNQKISYRLSKSICGRKQIKVIKT